MSSTTFFKALTLGLVLVSLCNVCLSGETPVASLSNSWEIIKNATSSVQVNEEAKTAEARPENSTNYQNPNKTTTDSEVEEKESWINKYLIVVMVAGVVAGLFLLVVIFLFIMKIRNFFNTQSSAERKTGGEDVEMESVRPKSRVNV